jgi:filamentous hemagglutinin family protein
MIVEMHKMNAGNDPGVSSVRMLQRFDAGLIDNVKSTEETDDTSDNNRKKLLCKSCLNPITSDAYGIEVNGAHSHTFMNPHGIVFNIGCFINARGCLIVGNPTTEFTWFPGYSWRHAICSNCHTHLGWHYQTGGSGFYGLILDRLTNE